MSNPVMDFFWAMPPVTRVMMAISVVISPAAHFGFAPIEWYPLVWDRILTYKMIPQVWRLATSYLLTGPKLSMIMDPYVLYTYGGQLEMSGALFTTSADYFVYIVFVCTAIYFIKGGFFFMEALLTALAYTYAQEDPSRQVNYFFVTFSVRYLPYAMIALACIMSGSLGPIFSMGPGIPAAHAYLFLAKYWPEYGGGRNWIMTPQFLHRWIGTEAGTPMRRTAGTAFAGRAPGAPPSGSGQQPNRGWTSGVGGASATFRGQGQRLGGE